MRWREANRKETRRQHGVEITPLAFIIEATCAALREFPVLNATWGGDAIILKRAINIGVAIGLDDGLVVPVIHQADGLSLVGLARAVADLSRRARAGQLTPADMQGGTFTVNNVGVFGSIVSTPIIHQPQAGILSAHAITKRVVVLPDDALAVRSMMYLALAFDHRVTDGMTACRFVERIRGRLEGAALPPD
jgi:2-oxoisovalerate dehydrogenase E2 component (dihydrolipoyl transacylase)